MLKDGEWWSEVGFFGATFPFSPLRYLDTSGFANRGRQRKIDVEWGGNEELIAIK